MAQPRLMVVDDDILVAEELCAKLLFMGYDVAGVVTSGQEAVEQVGELQPDLVLMDSELQGEMDGAAAALHIHDCFQIPVVYLTTGTDDEIPGRARGSEPFGYLPKPAHGKVLRSTVEMALDRHRLEAELGESESRMRMLLEAAPSAVLIAGTDGRILQSNRRAGEMLGYGPDELLGHSIEELVPQHLREAHIAHRAGFLAEPRPRLMGVGLDLVARRKDGSEFPVEIGLSYIEIGEDTQLVAFVTDISVRKQMVASLRQKENAIASSINAIAMSDLDGKLSYVNNAFLTMWHYGDARQVLGRPATAFWHDKDAAAAVISALFDQGSWLGELVARRQDGSLFDVQLSASLVQNQAGAPISMMASFVDITERRRMEEQVRKLSQAVEQSPSTVVITDTAGRIEYANSKFTELTGYSQTEVIGQNPRILNAGLQSPSFFQELWDVVWAGGEWRGEFANRKKDGELYWELASISPIKNVTGEITHFLKVAEDVTERRRAEEALRARNEELDAFAHTVAHDLKNPLGLLIGFAELLEESPEILAPEERTRYLGTIAKMGRKMNNIVDELLLLSSALQVQVRPEALDMGPLVAGALERMDDLIAEYQARIILPNSWAVAWGYGPWIEEVWANYLSNAVNYGGRPPCVELGCDGPEAGTVRFWVRDNGPGLDQEAQERLFVPFTQLGQAQAKGHGLGLSIVRRIVEKLGGQVGVESSGVAGEGCLFTFTLPAVSLEESTA